MSDKSSKSEGKSVSIRFTTEEVAMCNLIREKEGYKSFSEVIRFILRLYYNFKYLYPHDQKQRSGDQQLRPATKQYSDR